MNINKKTFIWYLLTPFVLVWLANLLGFSTSFRRMRDAQRNLDVGFVVKGLQAYRADYGTYPLSTDDGRIVACAGELTGIVKTDMNLPVYEPGANKPKLKNLASCQWGTDYLGDPMDVNAPKYISVLPKDPLSQKGLYYRYESDGRTFSLYAHFEINHDIGYDKGIAAKCGSRKCNLKRSSE